jgi:hypothetical protein
MSNARLHTRATPALSALALVACLAPGLVASGAHAADESCVGQGEYKRIRGGMTIQKLVEVLDGQTPFAETAGATKKQRVRWYAACEAWQPDKDVAVRYHQPVVGRRTVTKKSLGVYVAP